MTWLVLAAITVAAAIGFAVLALMVQEHAASDPTIRRRPHRYGYDQSYVPWVMASLAVLVIVGGLTYGTRHHAQVAMNSQTTGQSGPSPSLAPVPPKPTANAPATDGLLAPLVTGAADD
jgi:hypothetical protein